MTQFCLFIDLISEDTQMMGGETFLAAQKQEKTLKQQLKLQQSKDEEGRTEQKIIGTEDDAEEKRSYCYF